MIAAASVSSRVSYWLYGGRLRKGHQVRHRSEPSSLPELAGVTGDRTRMGVNLPATSSARCNGPRASFGRERRALNMIDARRSLGGRHLGAGRRGAALLRRSRDLVVSPALGLFWFGDNRLQPVEHPLSHLAKPLKSSVVCSLRHAPMMVRRMADGDRTGGQQLCPKGQPEDDQ